MLAGIQVCDIACSTSHDNGSNGTSDAGSLPVHDKIHECAGSGGSIVPEAGTHGTSSTIRRKSNPNTTMKYIKITFIHSIIEGPSLDSFDCRL